MAKLTGHVVGRKHPRNPGQLDLVKAPIDSFVKSLLHFNGTHGETAITDDIGKTWTHIAGTAYLDATMKVFGPTSLALGTTAYYTTPDSNDWHLSNADWTFDFWLVFFTFGTMNLFSQFQDGSNWMDVWSQQVGGDKRLTFGHYTAGAYQAQFYAHYPFELNTWYHIAIERFGNTPYIFINGIPQVVVESVTISGKTLSNLTGVFELNGYNGGSGLSGWIDEFRFSNGIARWAAPFVPNVIEY